MEGPIQVGWRGVLTLCAATIVAAVGVIAVFIQLYATTPEAQDPWATAADLEDVPALGSRLLWVVVDAMNADMAFDERVMPFTAGMTRDGAWGITKTGALTLTGPAIYTLGTGRPPTLLHAVENFDAPMATCDNLIRRLHDAGRSVHLIGEAVWTKRFGRWAAATVPLHDRGHHDVRDSDTRAVTAALSALAKAPPDVMVVHLVGADHVGHDHGTVGADGPYAKRLSEIDGDIRRLAKAAPPGTAVVVMADHGMTDSGQHGGGEDKPRSAPFVMRGPGIKAVGPVNIPQTAVAPTLAAYLGVPAPAEAVSPAEQALLALTDDHAAALRRNSQRQRHAVTGDPSGAQAELPFATRALCWALVLLLTLAMAFICAGVLTRAERRPLPTLVAPLLAVATLAFLPPWGVALSCTVGLLFLVWRGPVPTQRGRRVAVLTLLTALPLSTLPFLRWWTGHIVFYGVLVLALVGGAAWLFARAKRRRDAITALICGGLTFGLLVWTHFGLDVRTVPDSVWGLTLVAGAGGVAVSLGGGAAAAALGALALGHEIWPHDLFATGLLIALLPLVLVVARRDLLAAAWTLVCASAVLFDAAQLSVLVVLALLASGLSRLPIPRRSGPWVAAVPLVLTLLEAVGYLLLGKEYTFSSVQVALAFVGGEELNLVRAVIMVGLGDLLPWAMLLLATLAWARKGSAEHVPLVMAVAIAPLALRLLLQVAFFPQIDGSFWFASSVIPFMAATMVLVCGLLPVLGIAMAGATPTNPRRS